jgi:hypothetical protein
MSARVLRSCHYPSPHNFIDRRGRRPHYHTRHISYNISPCARARARANTCANACCRAIDQKTSRICPHITPIYTASQAHQNASLSLEIDVVCPQRATIPGDDRSCDRFQNSHATVDAVEGHGHTQRTIDAPTHYHHRQGSHDILREYDPSSKDAVIEER